MHLIVENFGPVQRAEIRLADFTVSVGPQATGKSLVWQLLKLLLDAQTIDAELRRFNIDWGKDIAGFLELYFGEGMQHLFSDSTIVKRDGQVVKFDKLFDHRGRSREDCEEMFYIPAQRVMAVRDGLTRTFADYRTGDPFVIRDFSDKLHRLVQTEFARTERLFPQSNRLNHLMRRLIGDAFFRGFSLQLSKDKFQKKLVLKRDEVQLPFMAWSAGQPEFSPLLLGLYWLMPAGKVSRRDDLGSVVIEEPEMGLHPKAISAFMVLVLELMRRGYRVCLSTHSPHILDVVWGLQVLKSCAATNKEVLRMFSLPSNPKTKDIADLALKKNYRVYYFKPDGLVSDISSLDPGAAEAETAGWGGLTEFTSTIGDVVAEVVSRSGTTQ